MSLPYFDLRRDRKLFDEETVILCAKIFRGLGDPSFGKWNISLQLPLLLLHIFINSSISFGSDSAEERFILIF